MNSSFRKTGMRSFACATLLALARILPAAAASPYGGIYVVIDPYNPAQITQLANAAQTPCGQTAKNLTTPFCGAINGIMLRIPWCDFQLNHQVDAHNQPYASCHYAVAFSAGVGSLGAQITFGDQVSPCAGTYDTCAGGTQSVLGATLRSIVQINALRADAGLPPLILSVGLHAGIGTPAGVLDAVGYVDVPHTTLATLAPSSWQCYRLPLAWKSQFLSQYEQALDALIPYVQSQMPQGSNIVALKAAALTSSDLEVNMPGQLTLNATAADPGPPGPDPLLKCSTVTNAAKLWLDAYNANPVAGQTFAQANESTFGAVIGHEWGLLANSGLPNTLISIATTGNNAFAYVDCGVSGAAACGAKPNTGNWSIYYLDSYTKDLFSGGLAYTSALAAYRAVRSDTFSFAPQQLAFNSTALSPTPISAAAQVSCVLNNTMPSRSPTLLLDSKPQTITGVGTSIGWQTAVNEAGECASSAYSKTLSNGINNGGQFIEVESDVAFTNIAQCAPYLATALTQILAVKPPTSCTY